MQSEDKELIDQILAGRLEAFESLVRKYQRMGGAIAYAVVGDVHLAEDVLQDAFLKTFRSIGSVRKPERFRAWFAGLVRSRAIDVLRQRRAHGWLPLADGVPGGGGARGTSPVEEEQVRRELQERIRAAIGELPEEDRLVVVLKHMEGLSYKEIAEILGKTEGAIESRLFRARQALKRKLPAERL